MSLEDWTKPIPETRDRRQSTVLVVLVGAILLSAALPLVSSSLHPLQPGLWTLRAGIVSLTFAVLVWALRAATPLAAFFGGLICLLVILETEQPQPFAELRSGLTPLITLFLLTFLATRAGKKKKIRMGLAEARRGRNAGQVLANLGAAGLVMVLSFGLHHSHPQLVLVMLLGVLAEATADTISSELGAAFGGRPFLITTLRRVEPGTDGAVSLLGSAAGCLGAAIIAAAGAISMNLTIPQAFCAFAGGIAGLLFDSLLGATLERRGWLGNDWVNFLSTLAAAALAAALSI